jgi:hypothetical protein
MSLYTRNLFLKYFEFLKYILYIPDAYAPEIGFGFRLAWGLFVRAVPQNPDTICFVSSALQLSKVRNASWTFIGRGKIHRVVSGKM